MVSGNLITASIVLLVSFGLGIYLSIQPKVEVIGGQIIDPNTWSLILVVGLMISSLAVVIRYGLQKLRSGQVGDKTEEFLKVEKNDKITMIMFIALNVAYIFSLRYIGYIFGTILYLSFTYRYFGTKGTKKLILLPLCLVAIFVLVFGRLLYIPLPRGVGVFYEITSFFVG